MRPRRRLRAVAAGVVVLALVGLGAPPAHADRVRDLEYWLSDYGVRDAWATTRGAGVTVAVIDTGIQGSLPDFAGAISGGTDVSGLGSADGQTPVGDDSGHGSWVGSLIAGRGHSGSEGVLGVAPEASLLTVSVALGDSGSSISNDEQVARGVRWAVDHGASVINMSLTRNTLDWPVSWDDAFQYAFDHDVVIVAAAGNRGSGTEEVGAPATIPGVLAVGGVDTRGVASQDASSQGITIGVAAPSEQLVGADPSGGYVSWSGTSGAAPIVSGIVALVRAAHPELDADSVLQRVIQTAKPVGTRPSPLYGYGLVDAAAAVTADVPTVSENPLGSLSDWITLHRRASGSSDAATSTHVTPITRTPPDRTVDAADLLRPRWGLVTGVIVPGLFLALLLGMIATAVLVVRRRARPPGAGTNVNGHPHDATDPPRPPEETL